MRPLGAGGIVVALLIALLGCTTDEPETDRPAAPEVPTLEKLWTSPIRGVGSAWELPDAVVLADRRQLTSLDIASGEQNWRLRLPAVPCLWSAEPSDDGRLAVLLPSAAPGHPCRDVALVDLRHGRVAWRVEVEHPSAADYPPADFDTVSTGERAVAATDSVLSGAVRLSARDGSVLSATGDRRFASRVTSDGDHLFALDMNDYPDDARMLVYDQDSGKQVASYAAGDSYELHPVLRDPLVVGADRGHGGSNLYAGTKGVPIGRGLPSYAEADGGRLASVFTDALVVSDLATGDEVAAAPLFALDSALGVRDGALITVNRPLPGMAKPGFTLQRVDLSDPSDPVVLGALPGRMTAMVGDTVIMRGNTSVSAYALPDDGPSLSEFLDTADWAPGDLRPDDVFDACLTITAETRRLAGAAPDARVVGSCAWGSGQLLDVTVEAQLPSADGTAVDEAEDLVEYAADRAEPVDLGDTAYLEAPDGETASLTARFRNAVITVRVSQWSTGRGNPGKAAVAAAGEVIAELERRAAED